MENYEYQHILNIPIYLYGFITDVTKVNLEEEKVNCKFNIYATIITNLTSDHLKELKESELIDMSSEECEQFIDK